jgi:hypothetical protein
VSSRRTLTGAFVAVVLALSASVAGGSTDALVSPPAPTRAVTAADAVDQPPPDDQLRGVDLEQHLAHLERTEHHDGGDDHDDVGAGPAPVTVEIVTTGNTDAVIRSVSTAGGSVIDVTPTGVVLAEIPVPVAEQLDSIEEASVREPLALDVRPEGGRSPAFGPTVGGHVDATGAARWHAAGFTGAGVKIGVIDFFNVPAHWNTAEMGPAPVANVTARCIDRGVDCSNEFFSNSPAPGDEHGPAVVEIIKDMAPDAQILIGRATTEADYYRLVDWFASNGVTIVNRSLGSRYDGPGDGRGALTGIADHAASRGMLWVNSGGNNASGRYYRHPVRLVGDRVAFGSSGTDTWLQFAGCISPGGIRWANDWDLPPAQRTDYDAFIHEAPIGNPAAGRIVASATARQTAGAPPIETFMGASCPRAGQSFYLQVRRVSGDPRGDLLEILDYGDGMVDHTQAPYSASTPVVDSRNAGVVSVGAIDPPAGGEIAIYSSQGPTNDRRPKPDLSAPVGFANVTFTGQFSGTSAAAPVVAGGAALLAQARLASGAAALGDLVRHSVVDRGPRGRDNLYGTGEFSLPAPPSRLGSPSPTPSIYIPLSAPTRVLDTRSSEAIGPRRLIGDRWPGKIIDLPISAIPGVDTSSTTAVAVNLTLVSADRNGYVQALPTRRATLGGFSNLNLDERAQTRPNFAVIPVGDSGTFSVYTPSGGDLVIDVLGTFRSAGEPSPAGGRLIGLTTPQRALDTRTDGRGTPLRTGQRIEFGLPTGVDRTHVSALVVNITGTETIGQGFVQAIPGGRTSEIGRTSTLNLRSGLTMANTAIVPVTASGVTLYAQLGTGGSAHVIADITGYITSDSAPPASSGLYVPLRPGRAYDSRRVGPVLPASTIVDVDANASSTGSVPAGSSAVVWNFTATATARRGFLRGWPAGTPEPATSSLNWIGPGRTVANGAVIRPSHDGVLRLRVSAGPGVGSVPLTHAVVDVFGYFT